MHVYNYWSHRSQGNAANDLLLPPHPVTDSSSLASLRGVSECVSYRTDRTRLAMTGSFRYPAVVLLITLFCLLFFLLIFTPLSSGNYLSISLVSSFTEPFANPEKSSNYSTPSSTQVASLDEALTSSMYRRIRHRVNSTKVSKLYSV